MSNSWAEIRRFLMREKIKFSSTKGHYDKFYGRYDYTVTIDDPASVEKFRHFQNLNYFGAARLVSFKIVETGKEPVWF
jgi:hypothetical protein